MYFESSPFLPSRILPAIETNGAQYAEFSVTEYRNHGNVMSQSNEK
jgi:hypothetical protein